MEKKPKNNLELFAWEQLEKAGVKFDYEKSIEILPAFSTNSLSIEKTTKGLKKKTGRYQNMVYSPDFSGDNWIIETKGLRRPDFDLRWKMFKYCIKDKYWLLLMPSNQAQVLACILILKEWLSGEQNWDNTRILQLEEDFKLLVKSRAKSKVTKIKKGTTRAVRKRLSSP